MRGLNGAEADDVYADDLDAALAFLRLAPDGRAAALKTLGRARGGISAALRYALGDRRTAPQAEPVWLWAAASRARAPWQRDEKLAAAIGDAGPDTAEPACVEFKIGDVKKYMPLKLHVRPDIPKRFDFRLLTLGLWKHAGQDTRETFESEPKSAIRGAQTIWPAGMEAASAAGARKLAANLDWWEANWAIRTHLEPLLDPDLPLREMALLLLVLGLAAKEPGERGLATDACIAAIGDGRLDGDQLGSMMGRVWPSGLITLNRWADSLGQVARTSVLHAEIIRSAVDVALHSSPKRPPKDLHALLGVLLELVYETDGAISEVTRTWLSGLEGSSKASKLAKAILGHSETPSASRISEIMQAVAEARIERAERWMGFTKAAD